MKTFTTSKKKRNSSSTSRFGINYAHILLACSRLLYLLSPFIDASTDQLLKQYTQDVVYLLKRWVTCEGNSGLKRFKTMTDNITRQLLGTRSHVPISSKYSYICHRAHKLSKVSKITRIAVISILHCHRLVKLPVVEDTSTITDAFIGTMWGCLIHIQQLYYASQFFSSAFVAEVWSFDFKFHISGKGGPSGPVAYKQYPKDLYALSDDWLFWKLMFLLSVLPVSNKVESLKSLWNLYFNKKIDWNKVSMHECSHSVIIFFSDKSGKTRVIAKIDIFSQSVLKGVHHRCMSILREIPMDGTYDQYHQVERIKHWTALNMYVASVDLSAATDRMPVLFQVLALIFSCVLSPTQALAWLMVATWRTFRVNTKRKENRYDIKYRVGQPMGALSSWPVMALAHHILVQWSYWIAYPNLVLKYPIFTNYTLLGDDLTIADEKVTIWYLWLCKCMGIEINLAKSYFQHGRAEFAKKLVVNGVDLSPIPLRPLLFDRLTIVGSVLDILLEFKKRKLHLTLATLRSVFPRRWQNLAEYAALSPNAQKGVLDVSPISDFGCFHNFLLAKRIEYFASISNWYKHTYDLYHKDPISPLTVESGDLFDQPLTPVTQIALDIGLTYPIAAFRYLPNFRTIDTRVLVGLGFIAYDSIAWPDGLPSIKDTDMMPGPTWLDKTDDAYFRSSLIKLNTILPGYWTRRCSGPQVGS